LKLICNRENVPQIIRIGRRKKVGTDRPDLSNEVLNSWKEIAQYLNRGIRTVQRWEEELDLPVRRPRAGGRSPVLAIRSELDVWIKRSLIGRQQLRSNGNSHSAPESLVSSSRELLLASRQLREEVARSRIELRGAISNLRATVQKIGVAPPPRATI
jgi:hypothetical protein